MSHTVVEIEVDRIKPSRFRLRELDEAVVEELAKSIEANGLLQPIMVKPIGEGYELTFGLHRLEACKRLGWRKIPSIVKAISSEDAFVAGLVENLQRNIHVNPVAEAEGYKHLLAKGYTVHEIAEKIGKSDGYVCDRLRILNRLHPSIQKRLKFTRVNSGLTPSHAERLALIDDPKRQLQLAKLIEEKHLSVRQLEHLTRRLQANTPKGCLCRKCLNYPCRRIT
jgi:ParB family chromosome partitioning protein